MEVAGCQAAGLRAQNLGPDPRPHSQTDSGGIMESRQRTMSQRSNNTRQQRARPRTPVSMTS
jgi:hypothetical protein